MKFLQEINCPDSHKTLNLYMYLEICQIVFIEKLKIEKKYQF